MAYHEAGHAVVAKLIPDADPASDIHNSPGNGIGDILSPFRAG